MDRVVQASVKYGGMPLFSPVNGDQIEEIGQPFVKRPGPVFMVQINERFAVETNEGVLRASAGDWLAYDPVSRHVWPVSDDYKALHYELDGQQ